METEAKKVEPGFAPGFKGFLEKTAVIVSVSIALFWMASVGVGIWRETQPRDPKIKLQELGIESVVLNGYKCYVLNSVITCPGDK
jgi:hypothetical protein